MGKTEGRPKDGANDKVTPQRQMLALAGLDLDFVSRVRSSMCKNADQERRSEM